MWYEKYQITLNKNIMSTSNHIINLTLKQVERLENIIPCRNNPSWMVIRANIILLASHGKSNVKIAEVLKLDVNTVRLWRGRWYENLAQLLAAENTKDEYQKIVSVLSDVPRSGAPPTFTGEQFAAIIALACDSPEKYGRPVTNWTPIELAEEAMKQQIVKSISSSTITRLLNEADIKPHLSRYWEFNERDVDPQAFDDKIREVNNLYKNASKLEDENCHVVCFDEKTGIQALERTAPNLPTIPGQPEKREFNYERHGTLVLTANFEVSTGEIISPTIEPTRTEIQLAEHIKRVIYTAPDDQWIFICDQLNTHKSESLVKFVANLCQIETDLGIKGKSGILESMQTRQEFLENNAHKIRFVYIPKHTSWMNQVEIWFSILSQRILKRGHFLSLDDLKNHLLNFIDYFNKVLARPFRWNYNGKPLKV